MKPQGFSAKRSPSHASSPAGDPSGAVAGAVPPPSLSVLGRVVAQGHFSPDVAL